MERERRNSIAQIDGSGRTSQGFQVVRVFRNHSSWSKTELEWVRDHVLDGTEPAQLRWLLGAKLQRFLEGGQHA
jgi:hypothetical protein